MPAQVLWPIVGRTHGAEVMITIIDRAIDPAGARVVSFSMADLARGVFARIDHKTFRVVDLERSPGLLTPWPELAFYECSREIDYGSAAVCRPFGTYAGALGLCGIQIERPEASGARWGVEQAAHVCYQLGRVNALSCSLAARAFPRWREVSRPDTPETWARVSNCLESRVARREFGKIVSRASLYKRVLCSGVMTVSHNAVEPRRVEVFNSGVRIRDWSMVGICRIGAELSNVTGPETFFHSLDVEALAHWEEAIVDGYLAGLGAEKCAVDRESVWSGYTAAAGLRALNRARALLDNATRVPADGASFIDKFCAYLPHQMGLDAKWLGT